MPLLEIVHTNQISPQVIVDLLEVGKKIKKTPVVVGNCTGFAAVIEEKRAPHAVKAYAKDDPFNPTS
ncbi:putative 3-hydroxyacyl-CoA dehydrogenase, Hydro-lyase, Isomerase [Rosa chinensis]|uniref:Putative 3-hydroxyacyl-CoA dehydrogenase, Hydro-lyase, Isomerase n=2 Tax=Rosa chinensis TaxID=74649 RepID=A0A2P6PLT5_ROSCH|nr:putative 3-hydroxyacyl-CoA dehydrogenase, Hydro-lyase, Isomerase [Rosa chinensis]